MTHKGLTKKQSQYSSEIPLDVNEIIVQMKAETDDKNRQQLLERLMIGYRIVKISGLGLKVAVALFELALNDDSFDLVEGLLKEIRVVSHLDNLNDKTIGLTPNGTANIEGKSSVSDILRGRKILFTGKLSSMTRSEAEELAKLYGKAIINLL
jgi:NAD-dependent DNA ligase